MKAYRYAGLAPILAAAVVACSGSRSDAAPEARAEDAPRQASLAAADVAVATRASLRSGVPVSGSLEPKVNFTVGAPVAEQIVEMYVDEGQAVHQAQPLARFKDDVLRAAAASARADVASQRMQVSIAVAESTRAETLLREGAIAPRDRDNALLALEAARARLALAEAQAAAAEDRLETATLKAPAAGVVSRRHVQAGDRVDFGEPVVDLVDTRTLQLSASVPVEWLSELRVGRRVVLTVAQLDSTTINGRISRINPTADRATRQVQVYVDIPNPRGALVGGLFVSGRVVLHEAANALAVPRAAVRYEGEDRVPTLYVVVDGKVAKRRVAVGIADEEQSLVEIRSGLSEGEAVIVGPVDGLSEGMVVQAAGRAPERAAGGGADPRR